ncbi:MAG: class I SAM-dependent methyltransferase [Chitinophagia bacterium]|nr:class I SAM-dependent methyltransferase [Chitinophagia bacterium]
MEKGYWEKIAPSYETEIFDVLKNDKSGKIVKAILSFASPKKSVIDIGCAVGKWMPVLAPVFGKVHAIDISNNNLKIAAKKYPQYTNITYERVDMSATTLLSAPSIKVKKYDAAICINAILTSSLKKRNLFFKHMASFIKKGGDLVLVVPSLESKLFSHIIANKYNIDDAKKDKAPTGKRAISQIRFIKDGVTDIDDVPTKHFLKEELELLLNLAGFTVEKIEKINYKWSTEFHKPPSWLKTPQPWDWMVKATKK